MANVEIEAFAELMTGLWPSCRMFASDRWLATFFDGYVRFRDWEHVQRSARKVWAADPGATKPDVRAFIDLLRHVQEDDRDEWRDFLRSIRIGAKAQGHSMDGWSDRDAYEAFVETQARTWTHDLITKRPYPDEDGRRAHGAKTERELWAWRWRTWFRDHKRQPLSWLEEA
jgi:hypothetical protein